MDIESVRLEILGDHHARLDDSVLLGQIPLGEELVAMLVIIKVVNVFECKELTVSFDSSSWSFLPTSLLDHSSVLSPDWVCTPGTTRGMADFVCG